MARNAAPLSGELTSSSARPKPHGGQVIISMSRSPWIPKSAPGRHGQMV